MSAINFILGIATVGLGLQVIGALVDLLDSISTNRMVTNRHIQELTFANQKNGVFCGYLENHGHSMQNDQLNEGLRLFLDSVDKSQQDGRKSVNKMRI